MKKIKNNTFFICFINNKTGENNMGKKNGRGRVRRTTLSIWEFKEAVVAKSSTPSSLKLILELPKPGFYSEKIYLERKRIKDQMGVLISPVERMYFDSAERHLFSNLYFTQRRLAYVLVFLAEFPPSLAPYIANNDLLKRIGEIMQRSVDQSGTYHMSSKHCLFHCGLFWALATESKYC